MWPCWPQTNAKDPLLSERVFYYLNAKASLIKTDYSAGFTTMVKVLVELPLRPSTVASTESAFHLVG